MDKLIAWIRGFTKPAIRWLAKRFHPNIITACSLITGVPTPFLIAIGYFGWASLFWFLTCSFDYMDGEVARVSGNETDFGSIWDSFLDRVNDFLYFLGILIYFIFAIPTCNPIDQLSLAWKVILISLAAAVSFYIPYVRAKAESLRIECKVGILPRQIRFLLQLFTLIAAWRIPSKEQTCLLTGTFIIFILGAITIAQRMLWCKKQLAQRSIKGLP